MAKYRRLKSILLKNNKKYAVDLVGWANQTLQGNDFVQFMNDMSQLTAMWENMISANELIATDITENLSTSSGTIDVIVGQEFTVPVGYVFPEKETEWYNRMAADPIIIKFNDKELILEV